MKHNLLKSVIISVILLMGVSNAWGKTIYLYTSDINWASDNAVLFVWSWKDDNQGVATKMTSATTNLYKADIADNHNKIIFMRMKNESTEISWGNNLWNRTEGDQSINDETPCFKLTAWGQNGSKECAGTWGKISYDAHIYLDNSVANWSEATKEFMIGHSSYSDTYTMTQISNTKLYYLAFSDIWHGYWDYGFIGVTSHWGPYNNQDITTRIKSATKRTGTRGDQVLNGTKLFVPENANNDATLNKFDYNSYNDLNHTQTIKAQVKYGEGETNPTYQQVISPATITATTKYFNSENSANGNGSLTIDRDETNPANLTQTVPAAYTSTVTLSYTNLHEAYEFMDWWDDTNSKTISTSAKCTDVATKATTIYARFKAREDYYRTVYLDARNWNADNPRYAVYAFYGKNEGQNKWIDMTPAYGTNWYYTCEVSAKYSHIIFCRMRPDVSTNSFDDNNLWGQTNDLLVVLDLDENNCFTPSGDPTEQGGKTYNGNWDTPPTFTVTLAGTDYGTYTVTCGEQEITVSNQTQTITNVPVGTTLTITDIRPNAGYDQTMVYSTDGANYTEFGPEKTLTVTANTIIGEDFRTTEEHDIYLKITANSDTYWINGDNEALPRILFVHGTNGKDQYTSQYEGNLEVKIKSFEKVAQNDDFKIYKITAPIGYHSFFLYPPHTYDASDPFDHKIILDDPTENCYELTDNETVGNGQWIDPRFTVTLRPTAIGQFTFEYNGQRYTNHVDKNVVFDVLPGETIILVESGHYNSNVYNGDLNKNGQLLNFPEDKIHVINENTEFKEDFVVKREAAPITVYLRIPKVLDDTIGSYHWQSGRGRDTKDDDQDGEGDFWEFANFVWLDGIGAHEQVITQSNFDGVPEREDRVEPRHYRMQPVDVNDEIYNIYTCTILDSCFYGLKFEYKHIDGDHGIGGIHQTQSQNLVNFDQTNCFTITGKNGNDFTGYWDKYTEVGDYRMLYVEQEVAKGTGEDNWKTVINRTKCHPSDIIKKGAIGQKDTVSLHINTAGNNPEVILQQYQTVDGVSKWVDIEAHMVNGPLKADAGMAMINGRRNAGANSDIDDFVYDDGIEVIKNDDKYQDNSNDQGVSYKGSGVWNFIITQSESTAVLDMTNIHRYNGKYYIRVQYKGRYWETYRISSQEMTYSSYSEQNSRFSHYFCEWLDTNVSRNVKFVVANEYSSAISDTLIADRTDLWGKTLEAKQIMVSETGILPQEANVRFSWEDMTNKLHRAYLRGAAHVKDRFLVVEGEPDYIFNAEGNPLQAGQVNNDPRFGLKANEEIFSDFSNWVYSADIKMKPNANIKLVAEYTENNIKQYLYGSANEWCNTILQGAHDDEQSYLIRLLYDFKTNELITAFIPGDIENIGEIQSNLMLIRTEDYVDSQEKETLKQLSFTTNEMVETGKYAYGVLEITKNRLTSQLPYAARTLYWVSFPFDVKVDDVLSSGVYGKHWIIQSYNGQRRADEGLYLESKTFWDYHFDPNTINKDTEPGVLKAGKGYVVALNYLNIDKDQLLDNGRIDRFCLYFRSKNTIENDIVKESENITITVDAHACSKPKREIADSHWNVIGVPSYLYAGANFTNPIRPIDENKYYYAWQGEKDKYEAISSTEEEFKPMHAYMVQYAGDLTWTNTVIENQTPTQIAARKNTYNNDEHNLRLEIQQNSTEIDRTFITLQEDDVTTRFDFNYDLCKITNAGANIYSIITDEVTPVQVAANVLPIVNTTIPVGVQIATAGEYTFAMPDGTDGITVELIDYETNTRTNLLLSDYTVNLPAGTNDTRFALHVQPSKVTTSIENGAVEGESGKVRKLVIDGKLFLQKDGMLYDAQGHIVR